MNMRRFIRPFTLFIGFSLCVSLVPKIYAQPETEPPAQGVASPPDSTPDPNDLTIENSDQESQVIPEEPGQSNPAEEAFERAMEHEDNNELDKAIEECTEALQSDPENLEYLNGRAHLYDEMRNQDKATADIERVLQLDPTNLRARALRGRILERSGDPEKALIEFNTAVQQNPDSLEALRERQHYFERQGQNDNARADAERMIQLQPDSAKGNMARALSAATDDQRINFASAAIQQDPENWYAYKLRGLSKAAEGDFAGAESDFDKAIGVSPDNALVFSSRGAMYYMQGDYEKSLADARRAASLEPRNCSIKAILADRLATCPDSNLRNPAEASKYAADALKLDPNEPLVWRACASAAAANGNFEDAKKWAMRVANSNTLSPEQKVEGQDRLVAYNSGRPYIYNVPPLDEVLTDKAIKQAKEAIKNGNFDRAIALCSEVLRTHDKKASAYSARGLAYFKNSDYEQAITDFTHAVEIDVKDADSFFYRARSFEKTKHYDKARDDLLKTYSLDPEDEMGMRNNVAWFFATCPDGHIRNGKKAAEFIQRALELNANDPPVWDTYAAVFAENGDFDNAIGWEKAYLNRKDITDEARQGGEKRLKLYEEHHAFRNDPAESATASVTPAQPGK